MKLIQLILVLMLCLAVSVYFARIRSSLLSRIIILVLGTSSITLVVFPDWSNTLAHFFGVGRGVDLVTYLSLVSVVLILLLLYSKQREMESAITELARNMAINNAKLPNPTAPARDDRSTS